MQAHSLETNSYVNTCWCGGSLKKSVHPLYGQCERCGTQVVNKRYSPEELQEFYSLSGYWHDHQVDVFGFPPIEERAKSDFEDRIPFWYGLVNKFVVKHNSLLEIGCSHGGFLYYCFKHGINNVVGVEVDEATCQFARDYFNLEYVCSGLFPDVKLPVPEFDAITGFDVIEHFADPIKGISAIAKLLSDNGTFIFQTPCYRGESNTWQQFKPAEHLYLYNESSIRQLFGSCGLEITDILPGFFPDDMFVIGHKAKQNILFFRTDSIGDTILASSMLEHIRKRYPQSVITAVCQQHIAELYEACPYIDSIIPFDKTRLEQDQFYRSIIIRRLQAINADLALNSVYSRDPFTDLLISQCGARERIALDGDLSNITHDQKQLGDKGYTKLINTRPDVFPELVRHQEFLRGIDINVPQLAPCVWTSNDDVHFAESFFRANNLKRELTIALFPCAKWEIKFYSHFGKALAELCRLKGFTVIGLGGPADKLLTQQTLDILGVPAINLCGQVTLRQTAELLRQCCLAAGADSALAHMACAVNTQNVIVLGGGHFGRFMPYSPLTSVVCLPLECYGCNWQCKYDRPYCIQAILPEVVSGALEESLRCNSVKPRIHVQQGIYLEQGPNKPSYKETALNFIKVPADVYLHKL